MNTRLISTQVSLFIAFELLTIPPPTTALPFRHDRFITLLHRRGLPRLSPGETSWVEGFARRAVEGSHTARRLPDRLGRNEFVILRTGHSPQVAPHPSSWKRSYHFRLQAGNVSLIGTCTLLFKRLHRRTSHHAPRDEPCTAPRCPGGGVWFVLTPEAVHSNRTESNRRIHDKPRVVLAHHAA